MKRFITGITAFIMTASIAVNCFAYLAGGETFDIDLSTFTSITNGSVNTGAIKFKEGGRAIYSVYIPADTVGAEFTFSEAMSGNITFYIAGKTYNLACSGSSAAVSFDEILRKGEYPITISTDKACRITKVSLLKVDVDVAADATGCVPAFTDFEEAIQTAVILHKNSPVITVNGGRRYINNDNLRETPYIVNNEVYLPLHSFARTFGYYYEQDGETILLSKEDKIFLLRNGVLTKKINEAVPVTIDNIIVSNENGIYVPIRYFAELEGKTVTKKDDFYIVEYPYNTKIILKSANYAALSEFYSGLYLTENTGKTYYVCQTCNARDTNDGSAEYPFRTIAKAAEVAKAGDTVIIRGGTYHEVLAPENDGTASNPITFKAAEGAEVVISATAVLGSPVDYTEDGLLVYKPLADLGDGKNQLFYKKENLTAGRHPNEHTSSRVVPSIAGLSDVWPTQGNIKVSIDDMTVAVSDSELGQEEDYWNGATFVTLSGNGYSLSTAKIEKSVPGKLTLTDRTKTWWFAAKERYTETDFGYITDHINTVDKAGEWAIDNGLIYVKPPTGETRKTIRLEQKVRQLTIDIADRKHIVIEGIDTFGGGIRMNNSEMCMLRDGDYKYISHYTHTMDQRDGFIDDRNIHDTSGAPQRGEMGIYLGGRDNILINNHIAYSAAAGIYSTGLYEYIENNVISDCGYMGSYVSGIYIGTKAWDKPDTPRGGNAIFSNTVKNTGRAAYELSTTEEWYTGSGTTLPAFIPDEVAYNDFTDASICTRDTGTVYVHGAVMGTDRLKSRFHHNLVGNSWSTDGYNCGVYYDNWMSAAECYNNLTFYTDECAVPDKTFFYQTKTGFPTSFATVDNWNNKDAGFVSGGKATLTADDYPLGRKFRSGADKYQTETAPMTECLLDANTGVYMPNEMTYSDGVALCEGKLKPSQSGDWIRIGNADFSNGENNVCITFSGDIYNTGDTIDVIIGESEENYLYKATFTLNAESSYLWGTTTLDFFLRNMTGKHNILIKFTDYKSACINKVKVSEVIDEYTYNTNVFASTGTLVKSSGRTGNGGYPTHDPFNWYWNNTYPGAVIAFNDVKVTKDCDTLCVQLSTNGDYNGEIVEFRIGSATGKLIGSYKVEGHTSWSDYSMKKVPLNTKLSAGTYDIYVVFTGKNGTTNFYYFGFTDSKR